MSAQPPKQGWTRWRRPALWTLLVLGALWAAVWFGGPPLLKSQIEKQGSQALGRELRVGSLEVFPSRLAIALNGLTLAAAAGSPQAEPQLRIGKTAVDLSVRSLWRWAPVVQGLQIDDLQLNLARLSEGHYDIDDLLGRFASKPQAETPQEPQRFALFNLQLHGAHIVFDDRPVARRHEIARLNLDLPFLSNLPEDLEIKVQPHLSFVLDGSSFDVGGQSTPFAEGRASQIDLRFAGLELPPWWAYVAKAVPLRVVGGTLDSALVLRFEQRKSGESQVVLRGSVDVHGLKLRDAADADLLDWQELKITVAELRPLEQRLHLQSVALRGAQLFVQRDATGQLNLQRLLPAADAAASTAAKGGQPAAPGWQVQGDELTVDGATVHWLDQAVQPAAVLALGDISLQMRQLQWPLRADAQLSLDARLTAADKPMGELHVQGPLTDQHAQLAFEFKGLQLAAAEPYLRDLLRPTLSGQLRGSGQVDWAGGEQPRQRLMLSTLRLEDLQLNQTAAVPRRGRKGEAAAAPARLASLELAAVQADALQRRLQIASLQIRNPYLDLQRDAAGGLNVSEWLAPAMSGAGGAAGKADAAASSGAAASWQLQVGEIKLQGGRARFVDAALGPVPLELTALDAGVAGFSWPLAAGQSLQTRLSAQLGRRGLATPARFNWAGSVALRPVAARGRLRVERFPVQVFEPYFGANMPVRLKAAEAGFTGQVNIRQQGPAWIGGLEGDALLADVRVAARGSDDELLSWDALAADGLKVELPAAGKPVIEVAELRLSDYYARLEITDQARFNLQQVASSDGGTRPEPAAPAAADAASSAAARVSPWSKLPVELQWGGVQLSNGRVDFDDHFIRPNYSAKLSELTGHVGRFDTRSAELADVDLKGRVGGTGLLQISGAVNPTTEPPALDLGAKASDIELPGLTPYAVKYAGYPIERGKLSVDVKYKIDPTGKLEAANHIVLNQLTFGEKTDSPDATSLPVRLAVALLQDRNGVIDIDLPVSGSINNPQFSLGGLIIKAIVNILTKALTAPFALLSGGGGPDLSVIGFAPGSATIDPSSQEAIAKVAKALAERPALKLTVTGEADVATEAAAMRRSALDQRIVAEQRRERARESLGKGAAADAALPPLNAEQRAAIVKRLYVEAMLPDSPMTPAGTLKELPAADMEARLLAAVPVNADTARQLAVQRGRAVREALIAKGLGSDRLFLAEPKAREDAKAQDQSGEKAASGPRAQLSLSPL